MGLRINTNIEAMNAERNLQLTSQDFQTAIQRLSSGLRINGAADDPAGLSLTQTLTAQINGFDQAQRNIQDGISMSQVADGALNSTSSALQRLHTLAVQASTDSLTNSDRANIQTEVQSLLQEIDRISNQTEFNTKKLLNGSAGGAQVTAGGVGIAGVTAQANLANIAGLTVTGNQSATISAAEGGNASLASNPALFTMGSGNFTQASSINVVGGTTGAAGVTFSATAGESLQDFISGVNASGYGITMSVDTTNNALMVQNTTYGVLSGGANNTGAQAVTISQQQGDFAANKVFDLTTAETNNGSIVAGAFAAAAAVNAKVVLAGAGTVTAQGINSDTVYGSGKWAGVTIKLSDPGNTSGAGLAGLPVAGANVTVTQNTNLNIQSSPNQGESVSFSVAATNTLALGLVGLNLGTQSSASNAISTISNAITTLSQERSKIGSLQNDLTDTLNNASLAEQNLSSSRSQQQDTNIASETIQFTRDQIILQAGTSVLAQANQAPAGLLALLH